MNRAWKMLIRFWKLLYHFPNLDITSFGDFPFLQTLMNANGLRAIPWRHVQTQRDRIHVNVKMATLETER